MGLSNRNDNEDTYIGMRRRHRRQPGLRTRRQHDSFFTIELEDKVYGLTSTPYVLDAIAVLRGRVHSLLQDGAGLPETIALTHASLRCLSFPSDYTDAAGEVEHAYVAAASTIRYQTGRSCRHKDLSASRSISKSGDGSVSTKASSIY